MGRPTTKAHDIQDFEHWLRGIFGSGPRGLASVLRGSPVYAAWRRSVEWCAVCKHFRPIGQADGHDQFRLHERDDGTVCPNSYRYTRWQGLPAPESGITQQHLIRLAGGPPAATTPDKEATHATPHRV